MRKELYILGGSPCSGKSTIAELIAKEYGFYYYKVDDDLDSFIKLGAEKQKPVCFKYSKMSSDEIWMRTPEIQNEDELQCYCELFEFVEEKLNSIPDETRWAVCSSSTSKSKRVRISNHTN